MTRGLYIFFLILSFHTHAAPTEFLIETSLESGGTQVSSYRLRVADGEQASISTQSLDPSASTALKVSVEDLGEDEHGQEQVLLKFEIQHTSEGQTLESSPRILTTLGRAARVVIGEQGHEPLRMQVKALRRL